MGSLRAPKLAVVPNTQTTLLNGDIVCLEVHLTEHNKKRLEGKADYYESPLYLSRLKTYSQDEEKESYPANKLCFQMEGDASKFERASISSHGTISLSLSHSPHQANEIKTNYYSFCEEWRRALWTLQVIEMMQKAPTKVFKMQMPPLASSAGMAESKDSSSFFAPSFSPRAIREAAKYLNRPVPENAMEAEAPKNCCVIL